MGRDGAVAITGVGAVTAQGVGIGLTWAGVMGGRDVLKAWHGVSDEHALSRVRVAVCDDVMRPEDLPERLWRGLSRTQQMASVATDEALAMAGFPREIGKTVNGRVGLFMATTVCGMDVTERFYSQYRSNHETADPELLRRIQPFEVGALLKRRHKIERKEVVGLGWTCLSTCVGSAMAITAAMDAINLGECNVAIAGGSEAICRVVLSGFHALKVTAANGCRPFDNNRPGMTVGEGAGVLVLENPSHAKKRGAKVLAYLRGAGITCDAHHLTAPEAEGKQPVRAMRDALARAGLEPGDIGYVNAHGTGTRDNDAMEAKAIRAVFGEETEQQPLVSSTKRCTGHTFGAAAAIEAILCVQALREGVVPVNAGSLEADPSLALRIPRAQSVPTDLRAVMSNNFAFGGNNTSLVITREDGTE